MIAATLMSRKLLPTGTILNRYRIESILGEGGFGVTYLAMEPVQQSYVAIKEYFPKRFANRLNGNTIMPNRSNEDQRVFKWGLKRFLDEAKVLARLDHPNIIKVQKYFELHGTAYLVMDYCDGKSLDKFVDDGSDVSPRRIFEIYTALINALEHVHQHGIIHGDLKPSNVLVRFDGTPVLLDFGSARQEMLRMAVGQVSDGYSPPEFYETSGRVGPWSDIYGLAATFYKLITGMKVPVATDRAKSDSYIPAATSFTDGYSVKFLELIDSSLRLSTLERPQSISSLRGLLPDSVNFNNRYKLPKDLRGDSSVIRYPLGSSTTKWKSIAIVLSVLVLFFFGVTFFDSPVEEFRKVEVPKVSPILIEDQQEAAESPVTDRRTIASSPVGNSTFQQALLSLAKASTSSEISWYSIPRTDVAMHSFRLVVNEIDKKFDAAFERKSYTYSESRKEYVFRNFSLSGINSLAFKATDAKCDYGPIGPEALSCKKSGQDFKCRLIELSDKYEHICLSAFSLQ